MEVRFFTILRCESVSFDTKCLTVLKTVGQKMVTRSIKDTQFEQKKSLLPEFFPATRLWVFSFGTMIRTGVRILYSSRATAN